MSVVSSEFGIGAVERGISGGLWLLDTVERIEVSAVMV
jgi:hypothetical protein